MARPREVVVAGAGVCGLALAAALGRWRASCRVRVLERDAAAKPDRYGITLAPNGLAALDELGLLGQVASRGHRIQGVEIVRGGASDGLRFDYGCLDVAHPFAVSVLPSTLRSTLREGLSPEVEVLEDHEVTRVAYENGAARAVVARSRAGERELPVDVLVLAGGPTSPLFPRASTRWPVVREAYQTALAGPTEDRLWIRQHLSPGRVLGVVPLGGDRTFLFWLLPPDEPPEERPAMVETLMERLGPGAAGLARTLASIQSWSDVHTARVVLSCRKRWSWRNVVLLGESAACLTPALAQGASNGIADAVALGRLLAEWSGPSEVSTVPASAALSRYERTRRPIGTFLHTVGCLLVLVSRSALLGRVWLSAIGLMGRRPAARKLLLEVMSGLRPRPSPHGEGATKDVDDAVRSRSSSRKLRSYSRLCRLRIVEGPLAALVGVSLAWSRMPATVSSALTGLVCLALVAVLFWLVHVLDDITGFEDGPDRLTSSRKALGGEPKVLALGEVTVAEARRLAAGLALAVGILGLALAALSDWVLLGIGALVAGVLAQYSYGARWSYRGLGEANVVLAIAGSVVLPYAFVAAGRVTPDVLLLGFLTGLFLVVVTLCSNRLDIEEDEKSGRRTLCVLVGKEGSRPLLYGTVACVWLGFYLAQSSLPVLRSGLVALPLAALHGTCVWAFTSDRVPLARRSAFAAYRCWAIWLCLAPHWRAGQ